MERRLRWLCRGARVGLTAPEEADQDEYLALRRVSASLHGPWEPAPEAGQDPFGPEAFAVYLARVARDDFDCLLVRRVEDDALVGAINLSLIVRGPLQSAYLGYWVGLPYAGQGYMTEALQQMLARAFEMLRLHRVEANIQPDNQRSLALAARVGFRREGYSPRYLRIDGQWRDHERWALLEEDWRASLGG